MSSSRKNEKPAKVYRGRSGDETAFPFVRRILAENFLRYRKSYALAIFCMVIVAATTAYSAYIIKDVVNEVFEDRNLGAAYGIAGLILLIFFTKGIAEFGQEVLLSRIGNNIVARYQELSYNQMLNLDVGFYLDTRSACLVGQINQGKGRKKSMKEDDKGTSTFARTISRKTA